MYAFSYQIFYTLYFILKAGGNLKCIYKYGKYGLITVKAAAVGCDIRHKIENVFDTLTSEFKYLRFSLVDILTGGVLGSTINEF